jgi:hypothetical protein
MADVIQLELDHILVTSNTGYRVRTISSPERSIEVIDLSDRPE